MLAQIAIIIVIAIWVQPPGDVVRQEDLKPGDHICTYRLYGLYTHHGIYVGEGDVIHLTRTGVDKTSLNRFQQEGKDLYSLRLYAYGRPQLGYWLTRWGTCTTLPETKSAQEVMNKAHELHEHDSFGEYDLISNNCEHFASFCRTSIRASAQTALISACGQKISEVKEWFMKFLQTNFGLEWAARGMHTCTEEVLRYENVCKPQHCGHYYLMCPEICKGFCLLVLGPPS